MEKDLKCGFGPMSVNGENEDLDFWRYWYMVKS